MMICGAQQYFPDAFRRFFTLVQMIVLFWVCYNLFKYPLVKLLLLISFAVSCSVFAITQVTGISSVQYHNTMNRISSFSEDPNTVGAVFAIGLLILLGVILNYLKTSVVYRLLACAAVIPTVWALIQTGSRGAMVSVVVGMMTFMLSRGTIKARIRNIVICLVLIGGLISVIAYNDTIRQRWELTIVGGDLSARQKIFPIAFSMFLEKPFLGWGPTANISELGRRQTQDTLDTHNLYLWLLTEDGVLGSLPFFIAMWICLQTAWKQRAGPYGMMAFALLITVLAINMSITWDTRKLTWIVFALCSAPISGTVIYQQSRLKHMANALNVNLTNALSHQRGRNVCE